MVPSRAIFIRVARPDHAAEKLMTESFPASESHSVEADDQISLFDLLIVLAKRKLLILGLPLVVAIFAVAYSMTMDEVFTANTKILQPQAQSGTSAMLAQLGGIASLVGAAGGVKNPNDVYLAMLRSRTLADALTRRFNLLELWKIDAKYPSLVYEELEKIAKVSSGKDGIITISVEYKDPKFAAELANAFVDELIKFTGALAVTEGSQRRLFFERQFALAQNNLADAEVAARQALQSGGLLKVDEQGRAMIEATARLRGQITVKEVQIGAMRTFAADLNPDLQLAQREVESMKRELAKIEGTAGGKSPASAVTGQGGESLRLFRDLKYREAVYEFLAKQYELAKIDDARDSSVIQVLDKAIIPDHRSGPKRKMIVLVSVFVAFLTAIFWAVVTELMAKAMSTSRQASHVAELKRHLSWR